jgi:hypothetical protein
MNSSPLERVQHDLDVLKSALASDFPYDRGSVVLNGVAGAGGVLFALRAVPGWDGAMTGVLLAVIAAMAIACGGWLRRVRVERENRPRRWSWGRQEAVSGSIAVLSLIVYAVLTRWLAELQNEWTFTAWRGQLAGPALFGFGVGMTVLGIARSERRSFLGWGMAFTAVGLAMPWIPTRTAVWVVGGVAMTLGGFVSTVVMWWQLRQWEAAHVRD